MLPTKGWAAFDAASPLRPYSFERREPGEKDIEIEIAFAGICHSDLHQARNEWGFSTYPMVPGHEIAGRVVKAGRKARKFRVGDLAGVGCMVNSCRKCRNCRAGLEQHCLTKTAFTYNSTEMDGKTPTQGGYSTRIVVDEAFALKIAAGLPLDRVAPLLCAGITTYSPLKRFGAGRGKSVGVMGLGGLGHMAVKLSAAMGAETTVLSRSASKRPDARRLGAHGFESTAGEPTRLAGKFDLIIDTISADHDVAAALGWLKTGGTLVLVGAPPKPLQIGAFPLLGRKAIAGSMIGGIAETQEMLDFCARRKVLADVEVIPMQGVNEAYERMLKGDVRYRFSIDIGSLR